MDAAVKKVHTSRVHVAHMIIWSYCTFLEMSVWGRIGSALYAFKIRFLYNSFYITKKDIPIPFSSSLHWPSLAAVGLHWPVLALADPILPHTDISENVQYDQIIMWATWTRDVCMYLFDSCVHRYVFFGGFFFLFLILTYFLMSI